MTDALATVMGRIVPKGNAPPETSSEVTAPRTRRLLLPMRVMPPLPVMGPLRAKLPVFAPSMVRSEVRSIGLVRV